MKTFERSKNAKELGIDTTRRFIVVNNCGHRINKGDILELCYDDCSSCPIFNNPTTRESYVYCCWSNLYYADSPSLRDMINYGEYKNI